MIHEIAPHKFDNAYCERTMKTQDIVFLFFQEQILLLMKENQSSLITVKEYEQRIKEKLPLPFYLFSIDKISYYGLSLNEEQLHYVQQNLSVKLHPTYILRTFEPKVDAFAAITASQICRFYQSHRFCGNCGNEMQPSHTERAMICNQCKKTVYPRISPAVIVAITDGKRLLMTRYARGSYKKYALVAGYAEVGESLEETVHREVMEEVGLKVKNVRYYKSQPWSFSDTMMVGFLAELDGSDQITLQKSELSEAVWFTKEQIPKNDSTISIGQELTEYVRNYIIH